MQVAPILDVDNIFVGSSDGNVYMLEYNGDVVVLDFPILLPGPVTSTPLLGANNRLFVPSTGSVSAFELDRGEETGTTLVIGAGTSSPNIWDGDGTLFLTTDGGVYNGICPNHVLRYQVTFPPTQSTVAITQDPTDEDTPIIVAAGLNGQVRAYNIRARQFWSFFASANINAAVLIDDTTDQFFVADAAGNVFAGNLATGLRTMRCSSTTTKICCTEGNDCPQDMTCPDGETCSVPFRFPQAHGGILASMALGRDMDGFTPRLYVADQAGWLYAVDRATGAVAWSFQAAGPIRASLAVATGGAEEDVIIVAADVLGGPNGEATDGRVYAISDLGCSGEACKRVEWDIPVGFSLGTAAPSIGTDGTGNPDGVVYFGREGNCIPAGQTAVVNNGGALYAIGRP
ncbi:MAG: PQQ-binding-like beta-propeller repeat protein [Candidatus Binatia bacterium]